MAAGAIRNSSHYGIAGYWAMMATRENMIGFTGTNARPSIAPTFGVEPMLGTNPFTIAMPTDEPFPFVIDCATSITQRGEIEVLARQGKPTPEGRVIGRDGKFMTDSDEILAALLRGEASFMPVGGYKGYSYATVVEILSAALAQGNYMKMLTGIAADGSKNHMDWGIISWFSIRKRLWESMRSKRLPGIFCALCVLRRLRPGANAYTRREKWNI